MAANPTKAKTRCVTLQSPSFSGQTQEDRRQALEKVGISVESSGIKVEKDKFFLVNLNSDPSLNELLVYYLKVDDRLLPAKSD